MKNQISYIIITICLLLAFIITFNIGHKTGLEKGRSEGFGLALDTVNKICMKQVKSDTTVTELTMVGYKTDTVSYFLSSEIIK
ncbi:hypothetical protein M0Q50_02205 [bacterium]|jgi:hypothetical protein|nr:hypothetical protein [bacterium]